MVDGPAPSSDLLATLLGRAATDARGLLRAATGHGLRPVLLSAWQAEGVDLGGPSTLELELYRARAAEYDALATRVREAVPATVVARGPAVAASYPQGWLRLSRDLDVIAPDLPRAFETAAALGPDFGLSSLIVREESWGASVELVMKGGCADPLILNRARVEIVSRPAEALAGDGLEDAPQLAFLLAGLEGTVKPARVLDIFFYAWLHETRREQLIRFAEQFDWWIPLQQTLRTLGCRPAPATVDRAAAPDPAWDAGELRQVSADVELAFPLQGEIVSAKTRVPPYTFVQGEDGCLVLGTELGLIRLRPLH